MAAAAAAMQLKLGDRSVPTTHTSAQIPISSMSLLAAAAAAGNVPVNSLNTSAAQALAAACMPQGSSGWPAGFPFPTMWGSGMNPFGVSQLMANSAAAAAQFAAAQQQLANSVNTSPTPTATMSRANLGGIPGAEMFKRPRASTDLSISVCIWGG